MIITDLINPLSNRILISTQSPKCCLEEIRQETFQARGKNPYVPHNSSGEKISVKGIRALKCITLR